MNIDMKKASFHIRQLAVFRGARVKATKNKLDIMAQGDGYVDENGEPAKYFIYDVNWLREDKAEKDNEKFIQEAAKELEAMGFENLIDLI